MHEPQGPGDGEPRGEAVVADGEGDVGAERPPGEDEGCSGRELARERVDRGPGVVTLAVAVLVLTATGLDAPEVEPEAR